MNVDLTNPDRETIRDLAANLATRGPEWSPEDLSTVLGLMAQHSDKILSLPSDLQWAGKQWAAHPEAHRLLTTTLGVCKETTAGKHICLAARNQSVVLGDLVLFEMLAHRELAWSSISQAETWHAICQKGPEGQTNWRASFWRHLPPEDHADLYKAVVDLRTTGRSMLDLLDRLLEVHGSSRVPQQEALAFGVAHVFNSKMHEWCDSIDDLIKTWPPERIWGHVRVHVDPDAVIAHLASQTPEQRGSSQERPYYDHLCDLILAEASPAVRSGWLHQDDRALPRARAAARRADLQDRPAPAPSRARRRT